MICFDIGRKKAQENAFGLIAISEIRTLSARKVGGHMTGNNVVTYTRQRTLREF